MKLLRFICSVILLCNTPVSAKIIELDSDYCDWYFSIGKGKKQYMGIVPGSNINDLLCNQLIPEPYRDNNLAQLKWIEDSTFTYVTAFDMEVRNEFTYEIIFEGLDTYAEVYLNNQLLLKGANMFITYQRDISKLLRDGTNLLKIVFKSAVEVGSQKAKRSAIVYPADNEEGLLKISPFIRKAAFQFGWDINPRLVSCGIWRPIKIVSNKKSIEIPVKKITNDKQVKPFYTTRFETDTAGQSFQFYTNGKKPVHTFMYGANYVPYNMYPLPVKTYRRTAHLQKNQGLPNRYVYYRNLFSELKSYGCNMLRVWGGGWYEDDYFYDLADSLHIAIWQDFMFANTMYPGDEEWLNSVKEEVKQQIARIGKHPCIVLWSGNNEIEVAWKNWGWQSKYKYTKSDSLSMLEDYNLLFKHIIPDELKLQQSKVAYISSSPISNWGTAKDFKTGDNHYWGVWHGEAPLENYNTHVPRFASEYGMPSLGVNSAVHKYNTGANNEVQKRMKSYKGMNLLHQYITACLPVSTTDTALSFASRYIQYKALKMAYNAHLYNFPYCSGSLFWQFNESWPGITWAAIDFTGARKIPPCPSAVAMVVTSNGIIKLKSSILNSTSFIDIVLKNTDGKPINSHTLNCSRNQLLTGIEINPFLHFDSLALKKNYLTISLKNSESGKDVIIWDTLIFLQNEKEITLQKPVIALSKIDASHLKISATTLVLGLFMESTANHDLKFNQNFIHLEAGREKIISVDSYGNEIDLSKIFLYSLYDLQHPEKE